MARRSRGLAVVYEDGAVDVEGCAGSPCDRPLAASAFRPRRVGLWSGAEELDDTSEAPGRVDSCPIRPRLPASESYLSMVLKVGTRHADRELSTCLPRRQIEVGHFTS